jgi:DNA-binding NarL/FixJ family response regulator
MRILIADDFADWRSKVREIIDHSSDIIGEARDGIEAIEKATQLRPDIAILDIGMPRLTGIEVAKLIRQRARSTAIVFLSENTDSEVQQSALSVGDAYILKHNAHTDLWPAIQKAYAAAASFRLSDSVSSHN